MSKSLPMLPSLAGGSGVAAHALVDTDLLWLVDAATLDADRDRKVTLAELKAVTVDPVVAAQGIVNNTQATVNGTLLTFLASYAEVDGNGVQPSAIPYNGRVLEMTVSGGYFVVDGWWNYLAGSGGSFAPTAYITLDGVAVGKQAWGPVVGASAASSVALPRRVVHVPGASGVIGITIVIGTGTLGTSPTFSGHMTVQRIPVPQPL